MHDEQTSNKLNPSIMLRTNSKKYLQNVRTFILESIDGEGYDVVTNTEAEKLAFMWDCFENEFNCKNNVVRYPNLQTRFSHWLMGLPTAINIPFAFHEILEVSKKLLEIETLTDKQEDNIIENYYNFMSYQVIKLTKKAL